MAICTRRLWLVGALVALVLAADARVSGQASPAGIPHLGRWQLNLSKSTFNGSRSGSPLFAWTYAVEGNGVRHAVYDAYPEKLNYSYFARFDGKEYPDPHGDPKLQEMTTWWLVDSHQIFREVKTKGVATARSLYTVSPDRRTLTVTAWSVSAPDPSGTTRVMVFDRVEGSAAESR